MLAGTDRARQHLSNCYAGFISRKKGVSCLMVWILMNLKKRNTVNYKIFSFSVRENLAYNEIADENRIRASLGQADILRKIEELLLGTPRCIKILTKIGWSLQGPTQSQEAFAVFFRARIQQFCVRQAGYIVFLQSGALRF